jgi:hypothetical protein
MYMKVVIPLEPLVGSVLAYTSRVEASGPLVILPKARRAVSDLSVGRGSQLETHQNLLPFNTQRPSFFSALSFMLTTSEPAKKERVSPVSTSSSAHRRNSPDPGSDMASEPIFFPEMRSGRYFSFCA